MMSGRSGARQVGESLPNLSHTETRAGGRGGGLG